MKQGLARIRAPALVLWGEWDAVFPALYAKRIRKLLSNAELNVIEGGHFLPLDAPRVAGEEIAEFIRRAGTGTSAPGRLARRFRPATSS